MEIKSNKSPVDKIIANKEKLIVKLRRDIEAVHANAKEQIEVIQFRIKMAQTLVDALKKGRA